MSDQSGRKDQLERADEEAARAAAAAEEAVDAAAEAEDAADAEPEPRSAGRRRR